MIEWELADEGAQVARLGTFLLRVEPQGHCSQTWFVFDAEGDLLDHGFAPAGQVTGEGYEVAEQAARMKLSGVSGLLLLERPCPEEPASQLGSGLETRPALGRFGLG